MPNSIDHRIDFSLLFDVSDGNPNGDPDMDNAPRTDPETGHGLVSDVCLKRKVRDYVMAAHGRSEGRDIYVRSGVALESQQGLAYQAADGTTNDEAEVDVAKLAPKTKKSAKKGGDKDRIEVARAWMCQHFWDVRTFGAVMSTTQYKCGQVRGPVQITFARSIDPVMVQEHGITRVAYTTVEKTESTTGTTEMGAKKTIPYGLYVARGFINPSDANGPRGTGFNEDDLQDLWRALNGMFEIDRSAARGMMSTRGLWAFEHSSPLGNTSAARLFDRIQVRRSPEVEVPRRFEDYDVTVNESSMPDGVMLRDLLR